MAKPTPRSLRTHPPTGIPTLLAWLAVIALAACQSGGDADNHPLPAPCPDNGNGGICVSQSESPLSYEIIESDELNRYSIQFRVTDKASSLYLYRTAFDYDSDDLLHHFTPDESQWRLENQTGGQRLLFRLDQTDVDGRNASHLLEVSLPRDLHIQGVVDAKALDLTNLNRMHFAKDAVLRTGSQDIQITAKSLKSDGGRIETYPANEFAPPDQAGKGGGRIEIKAQRAQGFLTVALRGQNGGPRTETPGRLMGPDSSGTPGKQGQPGKTNCTTVNWPPGPITVCSCLQPPGDGEAGSPGKRGLMGFPGLEGGHTGRLQLDVTDAQDLKLLTIREPGRGSPGGLGGLGGEGGPGGEPGHLERGNGIIAEKCLKAGPGLPGELGPRGADGEPGKPGEAQEICLRLGAQARWSCQ